MIDLKKQIESIIEDLANDAPISRILLKAQAIAFYIKDETFTNWIKSEQNGYSTINELPTYRKAKCEVKATVFTPFQGSSEFFVPVDAIKDNKVKDFVSTFTFTEPISEIEEMASADKNKLLRLNLPSFIYGSIAEFFPRSSIECVWRFTNTSSAKGILDRVKSKLLEFFLQFEEQINIDVNFDVMANKEKIQTMINQTIKAGVVNTGNGNISVTKSEIIGGNDNTNISKDVINKTKEILHQIESIEKKVDEDEQDMAQYIFEIKQELDSKMPQPAIIKRALRALKTLKTIATEKAIEYGIDQLIPLL